LFEGTFGVARDTARGSALAREMLPRVRHMAANGDVHALASIALTKLQMHYMANHEMHVKNYNSV